jgi:hypothetical protein
MAIGRREMSSTIKGRVFSLIKEAFENGFREGIEFADKHPVDSLESPPLDQAIATAWANFELRELS